jgi:pSer/pThr/pTyr-binding forkhead associated (FHA) protein
MRDSVVLSLKPGLSRDSAGNDGTVYFPAHEIPRPGFRESFIRHYEAIQSGGEGLRGAGVVVSVIGPSGFEGSAAVAAKPGVANVVTIGRHGHADIFLDEDPGLSLRQGAIVVYPRAEGAAVRFRILDLKSARPFEDEQGKPLEALEAEGPVLLRAGAYALFVLPQAAASPAPAGPPERAWDEMPDRVYLEEAVRAAGRGEAGLRFSPPHASRAALDAAGTLVVPLPGPIFEHERLQRDCETPRGRLVVRCEGREMTLVLGQTAVTRGVILGRYERCDGSGARILSHPGISRVHALVIEIAGQLYAIDTGSTNGLWVRNEPVRMAKLAPGLAVGLAGGIATLEWSFTN